MQEKFPLGQGEARIVIKRLTANNVRKGIKGTTRSLGSPGRDGEEKSDTAGLEKVG